MASPFPFHSNGRRGSSSCFLLPSLPSFPALVVFLFLLMIPATPANPSVESSLPGGAIIFVSTVAGSGAAGARDGKGMEAQLSWPTGVGTGSDGTLYVADYRNNLIRKISPTGEVTTLAGAVEKGRRDGRGVAARFNGPDNIGIGPDGNVFIADADNALIRKVTPDGLVTTVAGSGKKGYQDGKAMEAAFAYPTGVAAAPDGTLYVADRGTHTVRRITPDGIVETIAGNGYPGFLDGKGMATHLREPISLAVGPDGSVYVSDSGNNAIRRITLGGVVTTLAGAKAQGYRDGKGKDARFFWPTGIAADRHGNVYVCDSSNNKIRRVTPEGVVTTIAGSVSPGSSDGPAYLASFNFPTGIWIDGERLYIADSGNNMIRLIELRKGL